ncbi:MAG TPA: hypothetical protein VM509_00280 [Planctomycetota bacterium]|nr:hypothetical protein [Planctomycetota bacterium]
MSLVASCSGDLQASPKATDSLLGEEEAFDSDEASKLASLLGHSARIAPTGEWDGSIDGMTTLWYESGVKRGEGRYAKGSKEDAWTFWYENGRPRWEGTYKKDLLEGAERSWYRNGALCYEGTSVAGRRHGEFSAWYEDGQRWWTGEYRFGVRQGPFRYWRRDGSPDEKVSGTYVDGKRVKPLAADEFALATPN